ncbi:DinB family protein [Flavihumibacter sp. R14]|nr:DinB family protein [Flavihumibacter soli]
METNPVDSRMYSLIVLFDMHTKFFSSAIDGISDEDSRNRLNTKANHVAWLAGSLVEERFELAGLFGISRTQSAHELFKNHQGIQDNVTYPSLSEFEKDWKSISPELRKALLNVTEEKLNSDFEMMPGEKMSHYDLITFMTYREANCIGQIALYRRLLGYDAMKYM